MTAGYSSERFNMKARSLLVTGCLFWIAVVGISIPWPTHSSSTLQLSIGGYDYDRVRAIMDGNAIIPDAEVTFNVDNIYSLNRGVFGPEKTYDIAEVGLIPFISQYINNGFRDYVLIPVFISRSFRHRNVFIRSGSGIEKPEDLIGERVCTVGYGMSALTWIRGFLLDEHGVKADDLRWIESTESSDGAILNNEARTYYFDDDFPLETGPEGMDESELLLSGACNALLTAITPRSYAEGDPGIKTLFPDVRVAEQAYFKNTGVFPIMHVIAIRKDLVAEHPWLAKAVFEMYSQAKRKAYADLETTTSLKVSLPWVLQEFESTRRLMGTDYWQYGIEPNRKELKLIMRYVYEQGLVKEKIGFEELFDPSTMALQETIE